MSLRTRFVKGGAQLALGQLGQQALLLVRNIFIARLLPPEQFGIALTFITVISAFDSLSDFGIEIFLIRSKDTDGAALQDTLHTMLILRGVISAVAIFLLAGPISNMFGVDEALWAYQCLALVPLIRGILHLDIRRYEREFYFWPGVANNFVSAAVGAIAGIMAAFFLKNYTALLLAYVAQTVSLLVGSHFFAERKYELAFGRENARRLLSFGSPLIINSLLLFALAQGDRIVIGSSLGLRDLANYGVIVTLTAGVTSVILSVSGALYLPILSSQKLDGKEFSRRYEICYTVTAIMALATMLFFSLLGRSFVTLAFGISYEVSVLLSSWLGIQSAFKILRYLPQVVFLATAQTKSLLYANIAATSGLAGALILVKEGFGIEYAAMSMGLGEVFSALVSLGMTNGAGNNARRLGLKFILGMGAIASQLVLYHFYQIVPHSNIHLFLLFCCGMFIGITYIFIVSRETAQLAMAVIAVKLWGGGVK